MLTRCSTPWRCAASSTLRVPSTLVFQPSSGNRSRSGRCLSAAAWNTISGRCCAKTASSASTSRMSLRTVSSPSSRPWPCERQLHGVQRRLVAVEQDQAGGTEAVHLAGKLGADGAAGAGDQDASPHQVVGDVAQVGVDRVATQHVGDVDLADAAQVDPAADHLRDRGQGEERQAGLGDLVLQCADEVAGGGGDRQDDGLGVQPVRRVRQRGCGPRRRAPRAGAGVAWPGCRR